MSKIEVSIQWKEPAVFAGEEIDCRIVFTNTSRDPNIQRLPSGSLNVNAIRGRRDRLKEALPSPERAPHVSHVPLPSPRVSQLSNRGQQPSFSLQGSIGDDYESRSMKKGISSENRKVFPGDKHRRSVSIISVSPPLGISTAEDAHSTGRVSPSRQAGGHGRSNSLQVLPRRTSQQSSVKTNGWPSMPTAFIDAATSLTGEEPVSPWLQPSIRSASSNVSEHWSTTKPSGKSSGSALLAFKFPQPSHSESSLVSNQRLTSVETPNRKPDSEFPGSKESRNKSDQSNPIARVLHPTSIDGTPRSSADLYSTSHNSTETLASEHISESTAGHPYPAAQARQASRLGLVDRTRRPENLMMGYAQIMGATTLDGSLINQAPFEKVKSKGLMGGFGGGGVVGLESGKRDSGLFSAFSWGAIGESLGGFLGNEETSSIKEIKESSRLKTIPVLTTPQTILFVDLNLGPGESKAYTYKHPLPPGIPPSHRGRAMKVTYNLIIGTQRSSTIHQQHQLRHVDIPFRVLPGVDAQGDILGHNLMSPRILLRSEARVSSTNNTSSLADVFSYDSAASSLEDFLSYTAHILLKPRQNSNAGLLSPTEVPTNLNSFPPQERMTTRDAINSAMSSRSASSNPAANRFEIARNGRLVAVIMLGRPAYRLGDSVSAAIDFSDSNIACYTLNATLETVEEVDSAIALRSSASIYRATRRIHASTSENTLFARRVLFNPIIPFSATPEFVTTGVSLRWKLRLEFVTGRIGENVQSENKEDTSLLEESGNDDRGSVSAALPGLPCESFEVTVPLKVYGAIPPNSKHTHASAFPI